MHFQHEWLIALYLQIIFNTLLVELWKSLKISINISLACEFDALGKEIG